MKRNKLFGVAILLGIVLTGCSTDAGVIEYEETGAIIKEAMEENAEKGTEESVEETVENSIEETTTTLTFEELSKLQFCFSSGAGGWGEEFAIEKDGYFTGLYYDSDMGSSGEGYENGTRYSSNYSGHFTGLEQVDEYTYKMTLSDITYREEPGTEEIKEDILYKYTEAYCLGGNDTFSIYLPGTPLSRFSEDVLMWLHGYNESETELTMTVIVDEENGYGMYSHERMEPLEDARMNYEAYKESYDYYVQKVSEGNSTMEIHEYASAMYKVSDDCLNYLWNLIRYNVEEEDFESILAEQRQWVQEKERKAAEVEAEWGGGTFAPIMNLDTQAEMTIQRCEELLQYMEDHL